MKYRAQWRKQYRAKRLKPPKELSSMELFLQAVKLYKRGVRDNDRDALLAAQRLLDMSEGREAE